MSGERETSLVICKLQIGPHGKGGMLGWAPKICQKDVRKPQVLHRGRGTALSPILFNGGLDFVKGGVGWFWLFRSQAQQRGRRRWTPTKNASDEDGREVAQLGELGEIKRRRVAGMGWRRLKAPPHTGGGGTGARAEGAWGQEPLPRGNDVCIDGPGGGNREDTLGVKR